MLSCPKMPSLELRNLVLIPSVEAGRDRLVGLRPINGLVVAMPWRIANCIRARSRLCSILAAVQCGSISDIMSETWRGSRSRTFAFAVLAPALDHSPVDFAGAVARIEEVRGEIIASDQIVEGSNRYAGGPFQPEFLRAIAFASARGEP